MTYAFDILLEAPLHLCAKKFNSTENMKHWQRELSAIEHISGVPDEFGAKMKLSFKIEKQILTVVKTITHENSPHELHVDYAAEHMDHHQENYFTAISDKHTQWTCINEFMPLNLKMHLMLWLMPRTFKKQTLQYMKDFKNFVENGTSLAHA